MLSTGRVKQFPNFIQLHLWVRSGWNKGTLKYKQTNADKKNENQIHLMHLIRIEDPMCGVVIELYSNILRQ